MIYVESQTTNQIMASANFLGKFTFRSSLIRTGLLSLLAPICFLPAGQVQAMTFSRDPSLNGWKLVGNSTTQATPTFGGWANGPSTTASFNVYTSTFNLGTTDTVDAPSTGQPIGDCYLRSAGVLVSGCTSTGNAAGGQVAPGSGWLTGDTIVALGIKFASGQQGPYLQTSGSATVVNFDPAGTSLWAAGTAFTTPGSNFSFTTGSSDGSFAATFGEPTTQNTSPYNSYRVNPPGGPPNGGTITFPYGTLNSNGNNQSTVAYSSGVTATPTGNLPIRFFGNISGSGCATGGAPGGSAPCGIDYYTAFINQSLMQRNGNGEGTFGASSKWLISTNSQIIATGGMQLDPPHPVPGPLPLIGAGAALGWSRKLRRRVNATAAATMPSI